MTGARYEGQRGAISAPVARDESQRGAISAPVARDESQRGTISAPVARDESQRGAISAPRSRCNETLVTRGVMDWESIYFHWNLPNNSSTNPLLDNHTDYVSSTFSNGLCLLFPLLDWKLLSFLCLRDGSK